MSLLWYHVRLCLTVNELVQNVTELQAQSEVSAKHYSVAHAGIEYPTARDACRPERWGITYIAKQKKVAVRDNGTVADDAEESKNFHGRDSVADLQLLPHRR